MPSITFGRWNPTEVMERRLDGDWPNPTPFATNLVIPTSVDKAGVGSTATINTNGSVTFSACTSLSLNGVFTSDFDNYMISLRMVGTVDGDAMGLRLRSSGTDNSTASSYVRQYIQASSTTVDGARATSNLTYIGACDNEQRSGITAYLYGPFLSQPTAIRGIDASGNVGAYIIDFASTHNQSASYDGFTLFPASGSFTGRVSVYGLGV